MKVREVGSRKGEVERWAWSGWREGGRKEGGRGAGIGVRRVRGRVGVDEDGDAFGSTNQGSCWAAVEYADGDADADGDATIILGNLEIIVRSLSLSLSSKEEGSRSSLSCALLRPPREKTLKMAAKVTPTTLIHSLASLLALGELSSPSPCPCPSPSPCPALTDSLSLRRRND